MKLNRNLYLLALGVFGITTTEFGIIGVLPEIASAFRISIEKAGWL
jgi:predicted MFS family arabinose efflux permease